MAQETVEPKPKSEFAKLLYVLIQEVGSSSPMAFKDINIVEALIQADRAVGGVHRTYQQLRNFLIENNVPPLNASQLELARAWRASQIDDAEFLRLLA